MSAVCNCSHCVAAQKAFESMGAPPSYDGEKGFAAILYRNDRVRLLKGQQLLRQYRLSSDSPTRRVLAECCKTPMFLDFEKGFWLSLYRDRASLSDTEIKRRTPKVMFFASLLRAFIGLRFRRPGLDPGLEQLEERSLQAT